MNSCAGCVIPTARINSSIIMLLDTLQRDLNRSLKSKNAVRVATLRLLISAIRNHAINKYGAAAQSKLVDEDVAEVVKKQIKTHRESIASFAQANRADLVDKEKAELAILEEFAPKELSDDDLEKLLAPIAALGKSHPPDGRQDFGLLMKAAMAAVNGQADGGRVAHMLKSLLQTS